MRLRIDDSFSQFLEVNLYIHTGLMAMMRRARSWDPQPHLGMDRLQLPR